MGLFQSKTRDIDNDNFKQNKTKHVSSLLAFIVACTLGLTAQAATTFTVKHKFLNTDPGGLGIPNGFLAQGRDGNLYGTTFQGSTGNGGAFKISPTGVYNSPLNFNALIEGRSPQAGFSLGTDGNFYGTTVNAGVNGVGTIYRMTPTGSVTVLHNFITTFPGCNRNDAFGNGSPPIQGRDGNWHGTTSAGGNCINPPTVGTVYKLTSTNSFSLIHRFNNTDGAVPLAPLILGKDGNFYGTTRQGGSLGWGVVFRVTPTGSLKVLHNFGSTNAESLLISPLVQGTDGNFYGTTHSVNGFAGSIFKVTASGIFTNLHTFVGFNKFAEGFRLTAGLVQASDGNFYGTTSGGGLGNFISTGCGVLFKITPTGVYSVLHAFDGFADGCISVTQSSGQSLSVHTNGKIYGTAKGGGSTSSNTAGTLFELDIGARPFVRPQVLVAKVGEKVLLYGDFSGTITSVKFGGVNAVSFARDPIPSNSNNTLIVTIPVGAKTGAITVVKGAVSITGLKTFNILPTFTSFSPTSGVVGATVILKGTGLSQTTKVTFAANKTAPLTVDNDSQLTVNVPIGAVTGKISIATKGGSVSSAAKFTVTP